MNLYVLEEISCKMRFFSLQKLLVEDSIWTHEFEVIYPTRIFLEDFYTFECLDDKHPHPPPIICNTNNCTVKPR